MTPQTLSPNAIPVAPGFPIAWPHPGDAELFWQQDNMHFPDPVAPMEAALLQSGLGHGFGYGAHRYSAPIERVEVRAINGYHYQSMVLATGTPEELEEIGRAAQEKIVAAIGRLSDLWDGEVLPEVRDHMDWWARFDLAGASRDALADHLEETWVRQRRVWELHFVTVLPVYLAISEFDELYRGLFPDAGPLDSYRLLEGLPNMTVEVGQELWRLSREALASPAVCEALAAHPAREVPAALEATMAGNAFLARLDGFLQRYGRRADKWSILAPSWIEDPTPVIERLQDFIVQPESDGPSATTQRAAAGREQAIAEAREALAAYPAPVVAQFEAMLEAAKLATVITEDHNFWIDNHVIHNVRAVLLEAGRRLAEDGTLDTADDVFLLDPDELAGALSEPVADLRGVVAERADELERQRGLQAPPVIGTLPAALPADDAFGRFTRKFFGAPPAPSQDASELRGAPGSSGKVRGTARVISSIAEAGRLQPGDILVAETTAPPWTPLFATVAAVVTDTGGVLSHCAVVAREYAIPAVVGTGAASTVIADGQTIEVDGDAGIVRIV